MSVAVSPIPRDAILVPYLITGKKGNRVEKYFL